MVEDSELAAEPEHVVAALVEGLVAGDGKDFPRTQAPQNRFVREDLDSILQICEAVTVPKAPSRL